MKTLARPEVFKGKRKGMIAIFNEKKGDLFLVLVGGSNLTQGKVIKIKEGYSHLFVNI